MRILSFLDLPGADVNVTSVSGVERWWKRGNMNEYPDGRAENVLSYTIHGNKELYVSGEESPIFSVRSPAVFFIAANAPYASRTVLDDDTDMGHTICVKFQLKDENGEEIRISDPYLKWDISANEAVQKLFSKIIRFYLNAQVDQLKLKALVLNLLSELSGMCSDDRGQYAGFDDLLPAIHYIDVNYGKNFAIDELAKMCYMSNSHFRKRFKEYTGGESFTEYRNKIRVRKAEELLDNQLWSIDAIAQVCGFYDSSHFYRVYKKYTGETPREHRQ